jgi:hypothetical protein
MVVCDAMSYGERERERATSVIFFTYLDFSKSVHIYESKIMHTSDASYNTAVYTQERKKKTNKRIHIKFRTRVLLGIYY